MRVDVAAAGEIAPGGMKSVMAAGRELVVCNCDGTYYALDRRCGHMNAPLELGTLDGTILTCPMHHVQFDVTTGEALNGPVPEHFAEPPQGEVGRYLTHAARLMASIRVCNVRTFAVTLDNGTVTVDVP